MTKKWTDEEFKKILKERNPNIQALEPYNGAGNPILFKCLICGNIWKTTPRELTRLNESKRCGCGSCSGVRQWTDKKFISELKLKNKNVRPLEEYKGYDIHIKFLCLKCNKSFISTPHSVLRSNECPLCCIQGKTKVNEEFIFQLNEINPNIEPLEEYDVSYKKILMHCKICGNKWKSEPHSLLRGNGCPKCSSSKGERYIINYLNENNIEYIHDEPYFNDLRGCNNGILRPDFILPNHKIWIEFDGQQHFEPIDFAGKGKEWAEKNFEYIKRNDKIKNKYAKENGWRLIRISYLDLYNIKDILNNIFIEND